MSVVLRDACRQRDSERKRVPNDVFNAMTKKLDGFIGQWPKYWPAITRVWDYEDRMLG